MTRIPAAVVLACLVMMPRLRAEESLRQTTTTAVGSGAMTKEDADNYLATWRQAADPTTKPARPIKPTDQELGSIGIEVVRVPAQPVTEAHGD